MLSTLNGLKDLVDLPADPIVDQSEGKIFTVVEEMQGFPGGESKPLEYLSRN